MEVVPCRVSHRRVQKGHFRKSVEAYPRSLLQDRLVSLSPHPRRSYEVDAQLLKGIVEVDETFVGGEMKGKGRGYKGNKITVVGAIQRSGNICLQVVRGTDRETLHGFIRENVAGDTEAIYTDEWPAYRDVADEDTKHDTVKHRTGEYVRGDVHTNSIENVWSLLKRSIIGSYHQVSAKHLDAYLDELEFRFNNRENPYMFRDAMLKLLLAETLPYAKLIADS